MHADGQSDAQRTPAREFTLKICCTCTHAADAHPNKRTHHTHAQLGKWLVLLLGACSLMMATIEPRHSVMGWLRAVYYFTFTVPDLTPNVGLFWCVCVCA